MTFVFTEYVYSVNIHRVVLSIYLQNEHTSVVVIVALLFYVHGKHLRSCQDGQLT